MMTDDQEQALRDAIDAALALDPQRQGAWDARSLAEQARDLVVRLDSAQCESQGDAERVHDALVDLRTVLTEIDGDAGS